MRCEELKELIQLRVVDRLEPHEELSVRQHLDAGCPRCVAELASATETVSMLPFALPEEEPSPMAKAKLMAAVKKMSTDGASIAGTRAVARPPRRITAAPPPAARLRAAVAS